MDLKTVCRNCEEQTAEEKRELELEKKNNIYIYDICIHIYKGYSYFCPQHMPNIPAVVRWDVWFFFQFFPDVKRRSAEQICI